MSSIEDRDEEFLENILDAALLGATMALSGHASIEDTLKSLRVTATLALNGQRYKGLHVDSLSDFSYIIAPLANRLFGGDSWKQVLLQETPKVACGNHTAMSILGALDLRVQGDSDEVFTHRFYVLESFPSAIYAIIGSDLMAKLGITLINVPKGNNQGLMASLMEDDKVNGTDKGYTINQCCDLLRNGSNDDQMEDLLFTYRSRLTEMLEPDFTENSLIKGFCTHPDAIIHFKTSDEEPVYSRQYPIPHALQQHADEFFKELLDNGTIEEETAMDHSLLSILVVPKRNLAGEVKGWRTCLDPRKINVKISNPIYPLPLATDIFLKLKGKIIFSVYDLKSGFNQMLVNQSDRKKTAFKWNNRVYHFVGAPFEFKNIPQDFRKNI